MADDKIITIVFNIKDPKRAKLLWDALESESLVHGCIIERIRDGDYVQMVDDFTPTGDIIGIPDEDIESDEDLYNGPESLEVQTRNPTL